MVPGASVNGPAAPRSFAVSEPSCTAAESTEPSASWPAVTEFARRSTVSTEPSAIAALLTAP